MTEDFSVPFHTRVLSCTNVAQLKLVCLRYARMIGVNAVAYHYITPLGSADLTVASLINVGFPDELNDRFMGERMILSEPTIQQILNGGKARWWDDTPIDLRMTRVEREWLNFAGSKVGTGIHLPAYGPGGREGYVSMGFGAIRPNFDERDLAIIQQGCQVAHQRYCDFLVKPLPSGSRLSPREREILAWVAEGKSNGVIADILNIEESTVITYLVRAFKKLEVDNRVTAALRASILGEIRQG